MKTGSATLTDCPLNDDSFTGIVVGNGKYNRVIIKPYKSANNNIEYCRDIENGSWLESSWDTLNTWRPYEIVEFSASFSITANGTALLKRSDFSGTIPSGYSPVAIVSIWTDSTAFAVSSANAVATGDEYMLTFKNTTSTAASNKTAKVTVLCLRQ